MFRYGYKTEEPEVVEVEVDASVDELFDDWAEGGSKWGGGLSSAGYEVEVDDR